jgi:16S rRNA processing protein RimM
MKYIAMGMVGKAFGLRGEVRLKPYNPRTEWFDETEGVWLRRGQAEPEYLRIVSARRHKDELVLTLAGVRDRTAAEELRGMEAVVPEDELPPAGEGEYYWHQLVGLKVQTAAGAAVGVVDHLTETAPELGGNDVLVVATDTGELLIPFASGTVIEVDLKQGRIVVDAGAVAEKREKPQMNTDEPR